jgi:uncharacterized membrane protein YgaE (UPF0421/DUF939 family)
MLQKENNNTPVNISRLDVQFALAVGICLLMAKIIPEFQAMTACIATLLCMQNSVTESWKSGLLRLIITAIGGLAAVVVILVDDYVCNSWLFIIMIMLGLLLTLASCKLAKVPAFNTRIGGVTFILVVLTKTGSERIYYALFRLLSTLYGVAAVIFVSLVFMFFSGKTKQ